MKMLIYRIEDENGIGFYRSGILSYREVESKFHMGKKRHLPTFMDKGIMRNAEDNEKCGFLNEKQLYTWINKSKIRQLEKIGFKLVRLYREVTAIGEKQILFKG